MNNEKFQRMVEVAINYQKHFLINGYTTENDDQRIYGLSKKDYPNLRIWESIEQQSGIGNKRGYNATDEEMDEIKNIYYRKYYKKANIEYFQDEALAMQIFDFACDVGVDTAIRMLQRLMHITIDGICGRRTIATANVRHHESVRESYRKARVEYYTNLGKKEKNKKYLKFWLRRAEKCDAKFIKK